MFINVYLEHYTTSSKVKITIGEDNSKNTFKISLNKKVLTPSTVRNVILHEMGHAFGLEHYQITTPLKIGEHGTDRSSMYYSINLNDSKQKLQVKLPEMRMIEQLYGEDGWKDKTPIWTIKECNVINSIVYDCK
jgi:hypothetical protein